MHEVSALVVVGHEQRVLQGPFLGHVGSLLTGLHIFPPFCCSSAGFWSLHSPKGHKIDVYAYCGFQAINSSRVPPAPPITIHLLWGLGHEQLSRSIFIFIDYDAAAACSLLDSEVST